MSSERNCRKWGCFTDRWCQRSVDLGSDHDLRVYRLGLIGWLRKMMNGRGRRRNGSAERGMDEPVARQMDSDCTTRPNYIEHHVSKLDTLAGVAIMYGVEVKFHHPPLFVIHVFFRKFSLL